MQRRILVGLTSVAVVAAGLTALGPTAQAAPPAGDQAKAVAAPVDDLPSPAEEKRRALRQEALSDVLSGEKKTEKRGSSTVVKMGEKAAPKTKNRSKTGKVDQYVELGREKTDKIFVVLAEFGNERHPNYPDQDTDPNTVGPVKFDGPLHNEIPEPDRSKDNSTIWQADYGREHFQELYFSTDPGADSVANYYDKQSSGRYSVEGYVTDWVKVRYNEARYGRSNGYPCTGNVCSNSYSLVADGVNQWYADQIAAGVPEAEVKAQLAEYDVWDRNDYDGDGNFDEADGYIDHFQIVHAGGDQADGDPIQGEDAVWSHRSFAFSNTTSGPDGNLQGGVQIGTTGLWVGDYTVQPENGGIGVFAHEYGHDLGLPDLYDFSGSGGQNHVNWWSLMAQQRVSGPGEVLGSRVNDMDPWSKLQLGWLDYEVVVAGQSKTLNLGPHEYNSSKPQAVVVVLPDKPVEFDHGQPAAGENQWWSTKGDDIDTSMTRTVDLTGKTSATLDLQARYSIEVDFDYLYVQASTDGGATWQTLDGTVDGQPFSRDADNQPALTGSSEGQWADMNVPLDSLAGTSAQLRFRYKTDGAVAEDGFFADEITITADGAPVFTDGAEDGANGWTLDGFRAAQATETVLFDNFYIASNRTYESYDQYMKTGPYNLVNPANPDWVEHFPYETGLGVWYWDTSYSDNNTSQHQGSGLVLPVDAHPAPIYNLEGQPWRERVSGYDAPFSLNKASSFTLHVNGKPSYIRGQAAVPLFDDTRKYWYAEQPNAGVKLPATGTTIRVVSTNGTSMKIRIGTK
ncbi:immune inhibitor A domain-containing protein [Actinophytocola algeriensis]|uniref:Immune inhibitor A n=1 Tax=Actinophytocola algeriensis TaxID=1768010 RepID=A0A7W7VJA3_9PSEU|nr:immune inhibitor A domain-containing protein [Actinophytocola algeriensis]MBB4911865.1 immune inhibitor A [Actinophytocola algeriensis]MBE1477643.1 immune inhibitor A [Actinophytocola algeriensis]